MPRRARPKPRPPSRPVQSASGPEEAPGRRPPRARREAFVYVRLLLGLLLLAAAALKCVQLATTPSAGAGILNARWLLIAEVELEMALGILLISGLARRLIWIVSIAVFALFALLMVYRLLEGRSSCGCFGILSVHPLAALGVDLAALLLLWRFRPRRSGAVASPAGLRRLALTAASILVVGAAAAAAMLSYSPAVLLADGSVAGDDPNVALEPETWRGKPLPLAGHIDIGDQLMQGQWTVVLYHHDCPDCRRLLGDLDGQLRRMARDQSSARVAAIEVPPYAPEGDGPLPADSLITRGRLDTERKWFVATPTTLQLKDGNVLEVKEGKADRQAAVAAVGSAAAVPLARASHDFGFVDPRSRHGVAFQVDNPTKVPWTITKSKSECPCLEVVRCPRTIPAGGTGVVEVTFVAPDEPTMGYAKRVLLFVEADKKAKTTVPLQVGADVGTPIQALPSPLELGTLIQGEQRQGELVLHNRGREPIMTLYCTSTVPGCTARVPRQQIAPGGKLALPVSVVAEEGQAGPRRATLGVQTDGKLQKIVHAAVSFNVRTDYRLDSGAIDLKMLIPGQKREVTVEISTTRTDPGAFVSEAKLVDMQGLSGTVSVEHAKDRARIRCNLAVGRGPGPVGGQLSLRLVGHEVPVTVPIAGTVVDLEGDQPEQGGP